MWWYSGGGQRPNRRTTRREPRAQPHYLCKLRASSIHTLCMDGRSEAARRSRYIYIYNVVCVCVLSRCTIHTHTHKNIRSRRQRTKSTAKSSLPRIARWICARKTVGRVVFYIHTFRLSTTSNRHTHTHAHTVCHSKTLLLAA